MFENGQKDLSAVRLLDGGITPTATFTPGPNVKRLLTITIPAVSGAILLGIAIFFIAKCVREWLTPSYETGEWMKWFSDASDGGEPSDREEVMNLDLDDDEDEEDLRHPNRRQRYAVRDLDDPTPLRYRPEFGGAPEKPKVSSRKPAK
jgi:hypothetical protein